MAWFRRKNNDDGPENPREGEDAGTRGVGDDPVTDASGGDALAEAATAGDGAQGTDADTHAAGEAPDEAVPHVNISMSTYGKPGRRAETPAKPDDSTLREARPVGKRPPAEASTNAETVPGLRDNVLVRDALAEVAQPPEPTQIMSVARQLMQGHVFLRVKGDARALIAEGKNLPLSVARLNDKPYVLAYSGGAAIQAALRADKDAGTSAVGQPAINVMRHVLQGEYAGLILDHASSPHSAVLPRPLLERALEHAGGEGSPVKALLSGPRTAQTSAEVAREMSTAPLWLAGKKTESGQFGIAEVRGADGSRVLEVFTHPLELLAMGRGDQPLPVTAAQLAGALRGNDALVGVLVDPAGPWIRLSREDLAPLLEIAAP